MAIRIYRLERSHRSNTGLIHAFVVGIGQYEASAISRLPASVRSAILLTEWLLRTDEHNDLACKIGSIILAVKPTADEESEMEAFIAEWGFSRFAEAEQQLVTDRQLTTAGDWWRRQCASSKDNIALAYFVGHGISNQDLDHKFLLDDFGLPGIGMNQCISASAVELGMSRSALHPNMARRQLMMFDICGERQDDYSGYKIHDIPFLPQAASGLSLDSIYRTTIYAAPPGQFTCMIYDRSIFCDALIHALEGGAADDGESMVGNDLTYEWNVNTENLFPMMRARIRTLLSFYGYSQELYGGPRQMGFMLRTFARSEPIVGVLIGVRPDCHHSEAAVDIVRTDDRPPAFTEDPLKPFSTNINLPFSDYNMHARSATASNGVRLTRATRRLAIRPRNSICRGCVVDVSQRQDVKIILVSPDETEKSRRFRQ